MLLDSGQLRFAIWASLSSGVAIISAPNFLPLLNQDLNNNFGSIFPAIPFASLLTVLFALRWNDLHGILLNEGNLKTEIPTRILGLAIVVSLVVLRSVTGQRVESAGVALVATFYGMSLILNPLTKRIMFPYAVIYSAGVAAPGILEWGLGPPLVWMSTLFSAKMVAFSGVPVAWNGSQFSLFSSAGNAISGTVTPGCSSVISITTFLGLLGLMHLDMKKDLSTTAKLAVVGVAALIALNAFRITALIWIGYVSGPNTLWSIHNWLGYALFLAVYLATLVVYPRIGRRTTGSSTLGSVLKG